MSYKISTSPEFTKQVKKLAKKYPSVKSDLEVFQKELQQNPTLGTPLGNDIYKVRVAIASKGKGKRGGARIIIYLQLNDSTIILLTIYNKGDKNSISDTEIQEILKQLD